MELVIHMKLETLYSTKNFIKVNRKGGEKHVIKVH